MTEIINAEATAPAQPKPEIRTGGSMGALIPQGVDEAFRLAEGLVRGGGAPKGVTPMQAFTIIAKGLEVGFAPMQALATIANINGRLSIYGDGLIAIARRGGNRVSETLEGNGDARVATCTITRADTGETITRSFSVLDAKRAKLWGKGGPWSQYPDRMMAARARGFAIRDGLADKLFGLHVAEESEDIPQRAAAEPREAPASANRLQRRLGTTPKDAPADANADEGDGVITEDAEVVSEADVAQALDVGPEDPALAFDDNWAPVDPAEDDTPTPTGDPARNAA